MMPDIQEVQISANDQLFLRVNYDKLHSMVNTSALINSLQSSDGIFNESDRSYLCKQDLNDDKKFQYLIFSVLLRRGTYNQLKVICDCLLATKQEEALQYLSEFMVDTDGADKDRDTDSDTAEVDGMMFPGQNNNVYNATSFHISGKFGSKAEYAQHAQGSDEEILRPACKAAPKSADNNKNDSDSEEEVLRVSSKPSSKQRLLETNSDSEEEILRPASKPGPKPPIVMVTPSVTVTPSDNNKNDSDSEEEVLRVSFKPIRAQQPLDSDSEEEILRPASKPRHKKPTVMGTPSVMVTPSEKSEKGDRHDKNSGEGLLRTATKPIKGLFRRMSNLVKRPPSQEIRGARKHSGSSSGSGTDRLDGRNVEPLSYEEADQMKAIKQPTTPTVKRLNSFTDAFIHYEAKDPKQEFGKGLCLIIALFTADLEGYIRDNSRLTSFFSGLGYDIMKTENVTRTGMFSKIKEAQSHIEEKGDYDRLVVVVLTHGEKDGLMTCADADGLFEEKTEEIGENGEKVMKTVYTEVDEVVDKFKHNNVPSLKGMPKLILVQACRGSQMVKAANHAVIDMKPEIDNGEYLPFKQSSPIDGDIAVCYATTEDHPSLVNPHTGSWFIQKTIDVFDKHKYDHHVVDMMTVVNLAVAELRGKLMGEDGKHAMAVQMPCLMSTYRRQFYLSNPAVSYEMRHSKSEASVMDARSKHNDLFSHRQYST